MRTILPLIFITLLVMTGCNLIGATVGVGTRSGMGVAFSAYGDFLYSGNSEAYANNRRGLKEFLNKDFPAARETFTANLDKYPANPDALYYLGLTLIYQNERDAGYDLLLQYRDTFNFRIAQEVRWWAAYCRKKPELTPEKIHQVLNRARGEGFQREREEEWERLGW